MFLELQADAGDYKDVAARDRAARPRAGGRLTIRLISRVLFAAYFIEAGLLLTFVPWSGFWDRNYFAEVIPLVGALVRASAFRGAVTGVGVITALAGVVELAGLFAGVRAPAGGRDEQGP